MSQFFPTPDECGHHHIFGNIPITTVSGDHVQVAFVDIPADGVVEWHSHVNEQLGMLIAGRVLFEIGDEKKELSPGDFWRISGGVRHRVTPIGGPAKAIDVFYPIRDEYR
jgi:quercetin dioxygenase-like cupin family protein